MATTPRQPRPLDTARVPKHLAIIMDGNGRWAKSRGLPRIAGHKAGVDAVKTVVKAAAELGVEHLTLYSFSTENWLRPRQEVASLMGLLAQTLKREAEELGRNGVRLRAFGRIAELPASVRRELDRAIDALSKNTKITLNLALNYGARQEIVDAANRLIAQGATAVTEKSLGAALYTSGIPDPDLVIRTSGELRLSNFLLWQLAYAEIYVTPVCWPDFGRTHLIEAIRDYQGRERRFGGL